MRRFPRRRLRFAMTARNTQDTPAQPRVPGTFPPSMIVSEHFLGLTRLARHRAVLARVDDLIPYPVHALAIEAYAPDEIRADERMKQ